MKKIIAVVSCLLLAFTCASAHSGRTDSAGGHWNRSTGEYHYHHGYSAHQHPGGVCPYESAAQEPTSSYAVADVATDPYEGERGDYGPEAEWEFETKRDAHISGFESGVEYSRDSSNPDSAYSDGYNEGYDQGETDGYEIGYADGKEAGYEEGYDQAENEYADQPNRYKEGYDLGYDDGHQAATVKVEEEASGRIMNILFAAVAAAGVLICAVIGAAYYIVRRIAREREEEFARNSRIINQVCLKLNKNHVLTRSEMNDILKKP